MRPAAPRVGDADAQSLTRRRDRSARSGDGLRKPSTDRLEAVSCCAVAKTRLRPVEPQAIRAIVWTRKYPVRTPGKIDKPLWAPTFGGPAETKKARSVVASSRVPRWAGFAGSPPAAGLPGAVNWPLVQIPADRHTTTGTCVLGKLTIWANRARAQGLFCAERTISRETRRWFMQEAAPPSGRDAVSAAIEIERPPHRAFVRPRGPAEAQPRTELK